MVNSFVNSFIKNKKIKASKEDHFFKLAPMSRGFEELSEF
jgi:hypothetical protein